MDEKGRVRELRRPSQRSKPAIEYRSCGLVQAARTLPLICESRESKHELQRELDQTRVTKAAADDSKHVGRIVVPYGIKTSAGEPELGTVEQVEKLCSELQVSTLVDARPIEDSKIKVVDSVRA